MWDTEQNDEPLTKAGFKRINLIRHSMRARTFCLALGNIACSDAVRSFKFRTVPTDSSTDSNLEYLSSMDPIRLPI